MQYQIYRVSSMCIHQRNTPEYIPLHTDTRTNTNTHSKALLLSFLVESYSSPHWADITRSLFVGRTCCWICSYTWRDLVKIIIPWLGSSRPWYRPYLARDPVFEIFLITGLPQWSRVVNNVNSAVDIARCRYEQTIVSSSTSVTSQCPTMMTSHSKQYEFPKSWVGHVQRRGNHR